MLSIWRKRALSILLVLVLALGWVPSHAGGFAPDGDGFDFEAYMQELSLLVWDTWDTDYIFEVELRPDDPEMTVNGETVEIDPGRGTAPYISDEYRTMLPVHVLTELLDIEASFDPQTHDISITSDGADITLRPGSDTMTVNGRRVRLDTPPEARNGRVFVPIGAMADSLLYDVGYISEGRRIKLTKPYQTKRLILNTGGASLESFGPIHGVTQTIEGPDNTYILQFDSELDTRDAMEHLESAAEYCEPDILVSIDAYRSWGVERIGADRYQQYLAPAANTLPRITVAVLDTGVDASHPFLAGRVTAGWNLIHGNNNPRDGEGHGTHVAGTIAETASGNVSIMPVKVLDDNGSGSSSVVNAGIRYAADNGAR
ncbi:MAG: stalk domain-containing protein, partial [Oscillospiraceae bacterium]|nr:stalk domain-containing protein [Oscillospiraceae bacterium]